jgi:hypothetical protein
MFQNALLHAVNMAIGLRPVAACFEVPVHLAALSVSVLPNGRTVDERIWNEVIVALMRYHRAICLEGLKKTATNLSQGSRYSGTDPNRAPLEYASTELYRRATPLGDFNTFQINDLTADHLCINCH